MRTKATGTKGGVSSRGAATFFLKIEPTANSGWAGRIRGVFVFGDAFLLFGRRVRRQFRRRLELEFHGHYMWSAEGPSVWEELSCWVC